MRAKLNRGIVFLVSLSMLAGCSHEHIFGEELKFDETNHWNECLCGEKENLSAHIFDNGVVSQTPTDDQPGSKTYSCTVCEYTKIEEYYDVPQAPSDLVVSNLSPTTAELTWDKPLSSGGHPILYYEVNVIDSSGEGTWVRADSDFKHSLFLLDESESYRYRVRAVNIVGEGQYVEKVSAPITGPSEVTNLELKAMNGAMMLYFDAPLSDGGLPLTKYQYYFKERWLTIELQPEGVKISRYLDTLENGTEYVVQVRANNARHYGVLSTISGTPGGVPDEPTNLALFPGNQEISLSWEPPANEGASPISHYLLEVLYADPLTELVIKEEINVGNVNEYTLSGLTNGASYNFGITAVNSLGMSNPVRIYGAPLCFPGKVENLVAHVSKEHVRLYWSSPLNHGPSGLTYEVSSDEKATWTTVFGRTYAAYYLTTGTEYTYYVRALNDVGTGEEVMIKATPADVPSEPLYSERGYFTIAGNEEMTLEWSTPMNVGGSEITSYQVQIDNDEWIDVGLTYTYKFSNLVNNNIYYFSVRAVNSLGNGVPLTRADRPTTRKADKPQILSTTPDYEQNTIDIKWANLDFVGLGYTALKYYEVKRNNEEWINVGSATNYVFSDMIFKDYYTFYVRAVTYIGVGQIGEFGRYFAQTPGSPTFSDLQRADYSFTFIWEAPSTEGDAPILYYEVFIDNNDGSDIVWNNVGLVTSYTFSNLKVGYYSMGVRAVNEFGNGDRLVISTTLYDIPGPVKNLQYTNLGGGVVTLTWETPDGETPIVLYRVFINGALRASTAETTITINGVQRGVPLEFSVQAINQASQVSLPSTIMITLPLE